MVIYHTIQFIFNVKRIVDSIVTLMLDLQISEYEKENVGLSLFNIQQFYFND